MDELNEINKTDRIYYYEPKSIVNYSSVNFTNKKVRKHHISSSVNKDNHFSIFNFSLNNNITKNLFNNLKN